MTGFTVLPPKAPMGATDPQPTAAATNDNLRRNLWENVRLFAEEVAEAAAEGKESGLEPEEWTKINDTVNSIQLCLFLLREPYLSPTQVWLGHNQCKTTDRVSFKLSAIGREYEHDQHHRQQQQQDYPDDCAGSPATDKLRRRLNAKRAAPEAAASTKRGARGKSAKRARATSKKSAAAPMTATASSALASPSSSSTSAPASSSRKRCGETAHTVVQEDDSEEERLSYHSAGLTPPPAPTGSSSSSSWSSSWLSEAFNSVGLYDRHLRQTLRQPPPSPPYHAHHDLQRLAPSMVAAFPLQPTAPSTMTATTATTAAMVGSGLASLLACAEAETEEEAEAGGNDVGRRRRPNTPQARGGGKRRTVATASPSSGTRSPSDIYRLLN